MASVSDDISSAGDVGYLLTRLRMAKRKHETEMTKAIVGRLREIGILREEEATEHASFRSLRAQVAKILGNTES